MNLPQQISNDFISSVFSKLLILFVAIISITNIGIIVTTTIFCNFYVLHLRTKNLQKRIFSIEKTWSEDQQTQSL